MVKQNTKHIHKQELTDNKKSIASKLDHLAKTVAKRGMFFATENKKTYTFSIINANTKKVVLDDIPTENIAYSICRCLNRCRIDQYDSVLKRLVTITKDDIAYLYKHQMDVVFYNHTLEQSKDIEQILAIETRLDISSQSISLLDRKITSRINSVNC